MSDEVKFPLTKKAKQEFSADYEKIFLKKPVHNISDEKLVELVNANRDKITPDVQTNEQSKQEGIQDEENKGSENGAGDNDSGEPNADEQHSPIDTNGELKLSEADQAARDKAQKEREYQFDLYKQLHGEEANGDLSTDEIAVANTSKMNYNSSVNGYYNLFGRKPLEDMTRDQIDSAIKNEEARQATAKAEAHKNKSAESSEFDYNPETEMVIVNKNDKKDRRVIQKGTFQFLKGSYDAVQEVPKELLNKK